jgi:hypothetical protein
LEEVIERDGYFFQDSGHKIGTWCNKETREHFKLEADEALKPMFVGGLIGLHRGLFEPMEWFINWKDEAKAGFFKGSWENHRHDMTCGSIIAHRLGLYMHPDHSFVSYMGDGVERTGQVFHYK